MTDHLEDELRDAFAQEAKRVPRHAGARLGRLDYHPRTARVQPRVAIGAIGGTAVAAGATAAVVGLGASASPAFAGWSAAPHDPPRAIALTASTCGKEVPQPPITTLRTGRSPRLTPDQTRREVRRVRAKASFATSAPPPGSVPTSRPAGAWSTVLTDTRGPYTFAIYTNSGGANLTCFKGPSFASVSASFSPTAAQTVPAGKVVLSGPGLAARGGDPYTLAEGRVGAGVTSLTLTLDDGTKVKATVSRGWFLAWWPGNAKLTSGQVQTASGTTTQPLLLPQGPPKCTATWCGRHSAAGVTSVQGFSRRTG